MGKKVKLPSGAELEITLADFDSGQALVDAVAEEGKGLVIDPSQEIDANFYKDLFLTGLFSKKIRIALNKCMEKATYDGLRISKDTWEPEAARQDYYPACFEVAEVNIAPFTKSLYAKFADFIQRAKFLQA